MQLTRGRIIAAAMGLIEADGVAAVSMRRLATELGCGVMSLYAHVPSKSALLDGIADEIMSGIEVPSMPGTAPEEPAWQEPAWQEQLRAQARALRQVARAHPQCAMVAVSRRPASASMLRPAETALATLRRAGFGGQDAVRIVAALVAYIMGAVLHEAGVAPGLADGDGAANSRLRLRTTEFPQVTALDAELRARDPDTDFEFGLDLLVASAAALRPPDQPEAAKQSGSAAESGSADLVHPAVGIGQLAELNA